MNIYSLPELPKAQSVSRRNSPSSLKTGALVSTLLITGSLGSFSALAASNTPTTGIRINVTFAGIDADQHLLLKYGGVVLKTTLAGLKLNKGAGGVLGMLLPDGVRLQAEIIAKGKIQSVVLWKENTNMNQQLLIQGVAQKIP